MLPMVHLAFKKAKLTHVGYAVLNGMIDPLLSTSAMREAADLSMDYSFYELGEAVRVCDFYVPWRRISKSREELHAL